MDEKPSPRQRALAILIGTVIIVWIIYINKRLVDDVKQGLQPQASPSAAEAVPVVTPSGP